MAYVPLCQLREGQYGIIRSITCSKEEKPYKQAIYSGFWIWASARKPRYNVSIRAFSTIPMPTKSEAVFWQSEMKTPLLSL